MLSRVLGRRVDLHVWAGAQRPRRAPPAPRGDRADVHLSRARILGTTLTGLGVYDRIGKYAGAGSIVPITGFANSVCAPAMEFRREGIVLGTGAKLFTIAGPVLVYGITASIAVGVVYWAIRGWLM